MVLYHQEARKTGKKAHKVTRGGYKTTLRVIISFLQHSKTGGDTMTDRQKKAKKTAAAFMIDRATRKYSFIGRRCKG